MDCSRPTRHNWKGMPHNFTRQRGKLKMKQVFYYNAQWLTNHKPFLFSKQGSAIQANTEPTEINYFKKLLIPGKVYRISRFMCIPTHNWQQTLENRTSLAFTRLTKFDPIPSDAFPEHYFNFVAYNRLPTRVVDPNDKTRREYPVLTGNITQFALFSDVCACKQT